MTDGLTCTRQDLGFWLAMNGAKEGLHYPQNDDKMEKRSKIVLSCSSRYNEEGGN